MHIVYIYTYTCIHIYTHIYIHSYMQSYKDTCIHSYIQSFIHTHTQTNTHTHLYAHIHDTNTHMYSTRTIRMYMRPKTDRNINGYNCEVLSSTHERILPLIIHHARDLVIGLHFPKHSSSRVVPYLQYKKYKNKQQ